MIVIGIDPGLSGAVAFIEEGVRCAVEDLPTVPLMGTGLITRRIDGMGLAALIRQHCPAGAKAQAFVEGVNTMGGQDNAVQTQGSLMRTLGAIEAVLEVLRLPPRMVYPQTWKRMYGLDAEKAPGLDRARQLYPALAARLARVKDHNRAEAVLIAHYGLRKLT